MSFLASVLRTLEAICQSSGRVVLGNRGEGKGKTVHAIDTHIVTIVDSLI